VNLQSIHTDRLMLVPVTLEITKSLLTGSIKELEKLGIKTDEKWPGEDTMDILPIVNSQLEINKLPSGFELWMIIKKENKNVIGDIGFWGKPNEKCEVEIGFGLVEHERGKGYGYESVKAILDWVSFQDSVKVVKADCLIDNYPSARILKKAGMKEIYHDDDLIYWEVTKQLF
jgi:ribosomal-protein-alanine N-acetyltransferase